MASKATTVFKKAQQKIANNPRIFVVALVGVIGVAFLLTSFAASFSISIQPEDGQLDGVQKVYNGSAIMFGSKTIANKTCSNISQYGITWTFDKAYSCGKFANGDWWAAPQAGSQVTITRISPDAGNNRNGWIVNPDNSKQAYDSRLDNYDASRMPNLPYNAKPGDSIIKSISLEGNCRIAAEGHLPCLSTAAVLTILRDIPPNNGTTSFRPAYYGTNKKLYSTNQLQTNLLPTLAPVSNTPSLDQIKNRYQRVQLDHTSSYLGRYLHPVENFRSFDGGKVNNYGSELARDNADAALRLMLNDSINAKMPALINYVQAGIDWYGTISSGGVKYDISGGHGVGRKMPILFAGIILNDTEMKNFISSSASNTNFIEDVQIYYSNVADRPLFGIPCPDGMYEQVLNGGSGGKDCRDPTGQIDGGLLPGGTYQFCCTIRNNKASSLVARLMPGGKTIWNKQYFHDYVDRWVTFGAWTKPDKQNRFPNQHGASKNGGDYGSLFQNNMWNTYSPTFQ